MSFLEDIEIMQDKKRMAQEKAAIEKRDAAITYANDLFDKKEISQELRDKWVQRAHVEYTNPKGNILERVGGFLAERVKIAGENIAASNAENKGDSLWNTMGENFRNMKQDDFVLNIPQQNNSIDFSMIPQTSLNLDALRQPQIDYYRLTEPVHRRKPKKTLRKRKRQ